jgi:hypothetical protein
MSDSITQKIVAMGMLRILLLVLSMLLVVLMPFADVSLPPHGWGLLFGTVLPAAVPMLVMVLMLDALMCLVLKNDATAVRKKELNFAVGANLLFIVLLLALWLPVFLRATYF